MKRKTRQNAAETYDKMAFIVRDEWTFFPIFTSLPSYPNRILFYCLYPLQRRLNARLGLYERILTSICSAILHFSKIDNSEFNLRVFKQEEFTACTLKHSQKLAWWLIENGQKQCYAKWASPTLTDCDLAYIMHCSSLKSQLATAFLHVTKVLHIRGLFPLPMLHDHKCDKGLW